MKVVPKPSSEAVRVRMRRTAQRDTPPELALRSALHRLGLRFRVHVRPIRGLLRQADVAFPSARVAVFVDGCFWHGCPLHGTWPKANAEWWRAKIESNRARDADTDRRLRAAGWTVVRVWEHEDPEEAAKRVAGLVVGARDVPAPRRGSSRRSGARRNRRVSARNDR
jgi:DNA mismatch endonuclease (patch repair protein)